ncbi:hypothetical protein C8F04DRAFT_1264525 [Mycena alexandri]|uniref:F-box domain-containing protein n=1 Tax=Mycena alexandri TaxID=1745969 RepID=A0AAD6SLS6_9AGAR|nr:hypothetical protein C8F04DRAFT_1264525 [Mycena alexandri]
MSASVFTEVVLTPPGLRHRLAEIDDEMVDLQARLERLVAERRPIAETLRSVFYPVVTLPPEITAEIFLHYVDTAHIGHHGNLPVAPGGTGGHGPLLLASICRAWRAIALDLQPIWSKFDLPTGPSTVSSTQKLLECWLPRAGGHPLDLSISCGAEDALCADVAPYSHQFRSLRCSLFTPITRPGSLIAGRLPLLRKLLITFPRGLNHATLVTTFADAPQLREVHLEGLALAWIALPWAQLTCLGLSELNVTQCVHLLHQTPNLETLTVTGLENDADVALAPVRLAHLHTLKFDEYQRDTTLLLYLTLPALAHLELPAAIWDLTQYFIDFVARSACALRSLVFSYTNNTDIPFDLVPYLRAVPTLSELRIREAEWSVHNLKAFFTLMAEPGFLPNLRALSFNPLRYAVEIPYGALAAFLASRWQGRGSGPDDARLESFELVLAPESDFDPAPSFMQLQDDLDALRALEADGPKLNIRGLHKITGTVDALAVYPPFNRLP